MTCVIGYIDSKGNGHIAADSAGTDVAYHKRIDINSSKIFRKNEMLIGYTTSFRMGQILEHCLTFPERQEGLTDYQYLIKQVIPIIRKAFVDENYMKETDKNGGTFIIVWNGVIYEIQNDFSVFSHSRPFAACGSGTPQAEGYIAACIHNGILKDDNVETVLKAAVETVGTFNITVSGRVDYLTI